MLYFLKSIKYLTLLFVLFFGIGFSQTNLVTNPGFENHTTCPNFGGQINFCSNWDNVNLVYGSFTVGTPDYFHSCGSGGVVPPNTFAGQCSPHTGGAMTALVMYNNPYLGYREYMSTPLSCPMTPGNTYTVSFWLTNGLNPISQYRIKNIGIHFSNTPLTQSGYSIINVIPQVEITNYSGSTSWVQYTYTISPTTSWQYMTIGSFRSDALNSALSSYSITTGAPSVYANYFFDDIQVLSSVTTGTFSAASSVTNIACNGFSTGSATVTATGLGPYTYLWAPGNYTTPSVSNLSAGIYTVTISDGACASSEVDVTVSQPSSLMSILTKNTTDLCDSSGVNYVLTNNGGTPNYTVNWSNGIMNSNSITLATSISGVYNYTVTDSNNCVVTQTFHVNASQMSFENENIPNVFTPNGDGINDRFDFRIIEKCNDFSFEIFNRWGLSILKSSNSNRYFWDGRTTSGEAVTDGTYFYIMDVNNGAKSKGTVTVFR